MTDEKDELTGIDLEVHVVQRGLVGLRGVDLGDVLHENYGLDAGLAGLTSTGILDRGEHRGEVGIVGERRVQGCDLICLIGGDDAGGGTGLRHEDTGLGDLLGRRRSGIHRRGDVRARGRGILGRGDAEQGIGGSLRRRGRLALVQGRKALSRGNVGGRCGGIEYGMLDRLLKQAVLRGGRRLGVRRRGRADLRHLRRHRLFARRTEVVTH